MVVTLRVMSEWTTARPSRIIKMNFEFGNICLRYIAVLRVKGSLLQSLVDGGPCLAIISKINAATAESKTSDVTPASCNLLDSNGAFIHCCRRPNIRGTTRVSSPHRISGCASSKTRKSVVPDRGIPPMKMSGILRSYMNLCSLPSSLVTTYLCE